MGVRGWWKVPISSSSKFWDITLEHLLLSDFQVKSLLDAICPPAVAPASASPPNMSCAVSKADEEIAPFTFDVHLSGNDSSSDDDISCVGSGGSVLNMSPSRGNNILCGNVDEVAEATEFNSSGDLFLDYA